MKLNPYPAYKDSGLPWLGTIPAHWEVLRNGRLFAQRVETGFPDLPILEVSLRTGVRVRDLDDTKRKQVMNNREQYKRAARDDIAYNMMRMWQGAVGVVPTDGLVSPAYVVARPFPETDSRYYGYLFRTAAYMNEVNKYSRGIVTDRNRLYWDEFKQMPSIFPPPGEQQNIADILDSHDRAVRRFIRAKRRLIELLNEQKQAIIHRAVTSGLDPNARLKSSDIDWLGDVPKHWDVVPLRWYISIGSGEFLSADQLGSERTSERPYPAIGGNGVMAYASRFNTQEVTVVIGRVGALCGNIHLVTEPSWITDNALKVTNVKGFDLEYLALQLRAMNLNRLANANAQPLVTGGMIKSQRVIKPTTQEQSRIVQQLREAIVPAESAINRAQREIDLIREYRTRLIADVVTGKLDVRGVELLELDATTVLDDFDDSEDVADLAEETGDVEVIEKEDAD